MTHRLPARLKRRISWTVFLAALLSALTSAVAPGPSVSVAGHLTVAEHGRETRAAAAKPNAVRLTTADLALDLGGGLDDPGSPLAARDFDARHEASSRERALPVPFGLPDNAARTRDGLTRAPPRA